MSQKQQGSALAVVLVVFGALFVIAGLVVMMFIGANNTAVDFDAQLKAEHTRNKTLLANHYQTSVEVAQVPGMMAEDVQKVAIAAIEGRYGKDGSKAVFQALQEQNPTLDSSLYAKVQQVIESGRKEFQLGQERLTDKVRAYESALGRFPQGMFMRVLGVPKVPLATYNIVITEGAAKAFETGKEAGPVQLRAK